MWLRSPVESRGVCAGPGRMRPAGCVTRSGPRRWCRSSTKAANRSVRDRPGTVRCCASKPPAPAPMPSVSRPWLMWSTLTASFAKGTASRKLAELTSVPSRMVLVSPATPVNTGIALSHGWLGAPRQIRWSKVQPWRAPARSAHCQREASAGHGASGRMTTPTCMR